MILFINRKIWLTWQLPNILTAVIYASGKFNQVVIYMSKKKITVDIYYLISLVVVIY